MWYRLVADLVVAIHIAYVAYIIVGAMLILVGLKCKWGWVRNPWFRLTHFAAILIVVLELIFKTTCPLTVLEFKFRSLAGQPVTETTFVERLMYYILSGWLPGSLTNSVYVVVGVVVALTFVLVPPRWRPEKPAATHSPQTANYSQRSATIGSTRVARRDGR